jgi:ABC-type transport system involved in cytochrome bd biosynthesis fused ATPase/permease subunit
MKRNEILKSVLMVVIIKFIMVLGAVFVVTMLLNGYVHNPNALFIVAACFAFMPLFAALSRLVETLQNIINLRENIAKSVKNENKEYRDSL